jgi:uncharacterized protein (TIGR02147 family)
MVFEHSSYRSFLKAVLAERLGKNPAYSLRSMARQLSLAPASLSNVLRGKKNLAPGTALRVARQLALSAPEEEYFCLLVQLEGAKNPDLRSALLEKLRAINPARPPKDLGTDYFVVISDWYHFPILQLAGLPGFSFTPAEIARRLGITVLEARAAVERLARLELLQQDEAGSYHRSSDYVVVRSERTDFAIRKFNQQMLQKALEALREQDSRERWGGSETFLFARESMPRAKKMIDQFLGRMARLSGESARNTDVYHVQVQLFNLTQEKKT